MQVFWGKWAADRLTMLKSARSPAVQRTLPKTGCLEDKEVDEIGYFKMLSVFSLFKK